MKHNIWRKVKVLFVIYIVVRLVQSHQIVLFQIKNVHDPTGNNTWGSLTLFVLGSLSKEHDTLGRLKISEFLDLYGSSITVYYVIYRS